MVKGTPRDMIKKQMISDQGLDFLPGESRVIQRKAEGAAGIQKKTAGTIQNSGIVFLT